MSGISQYFSGEVRLNTGGGGEIRLPALVGTALSAPENFDTLDIISNDLFDINYTAGLQYPIITIPLAVTKEWFNAATLNAWFGLPTRSGPYYDVSAIGTCEFWAGPSGSNNGWQMSGIKASTLRLGQTLGGHTEAYLELMGIDINPYTFTPDSTPFLTAPARSQNATHNIASNPTRWDLTLTNNLMVNDEIPTHGSLTGTFEHPTELNSGRFQASSQLTFQRHNVTLASPVDGTAFFVTIHPPGAAGGADVKITVQNPLYTNRYGQNLQRPRQKLTLGVICQGKTDGTPPITIAAV